MTSGDRIIILLGEVREDVGELRGEIRGVRVQLTDVSTQVREQGERLASLPCEHHRKRITDLFKRAEGSARFIELESHRRQMLRACLSMTWKIARVAIPALVAGGGIAAALAALTGGCSWMQ